MERTIIAHYGVIRETRQLDVEDQLQELSGREQSSAETVDKIQRRKRREALLQKEQQRCSFIEQNSRFRISPIYLSEVYLANEQDDSDSEETRTYAKEKGGQIIIWQSLTFALCSCSSKRS